MTRLSPDAEKLLASARRARPSERAKERGRARLLATASFGAASAASLTAKATLWGGGSLLTAVTAPFLLGAALGVGGLAIATRVAPSRAVAPPAKVTDVRPPAASAVQAPAPVKPPPLMSAVSPSKAPPPASRQVEVPSIERETELIARAQRALAGGRASEALSILAAYGREFPRGALLEEAAGARVVALCQAHSGQAEAARLDFLETYPSSPLATRLSSVCKAKAP